ncbi:MAG: PEP-CTERM sorting domain-containing protein [Planctomycetales bacterium]|nr:PEP-CTERM sorting domain-containing protein [Planctomycetales bacterium]
MSLIVLAAAIVLAPDARAELTTNGDFETGDTTGWTSFAFGSQTFSLTTDAKSGSFAGELFNTIEASPLVIKQANIGAGTVIAGELLTISFDAKGEGTNGGVAFAEFFSERAGGGVSSSEILGGAPLALTNQYQNFSFTRAAGPDVGGGVTLQFNAVTGANAGSTSRLLIDNVSVRRVSAVPEPGSTILLGLAGCGFLVRRRRR